MIAVAYVADGLGGAGRELELGLDALVDVDVAAGAGPCARAVALVVTDAHTAVLARRALPCA